MSVTRLGDLLDFGKVLKPSATINLPKSSIIEFKTEKKQMLRFASKIQKYTYDVQSTMANTIKPTSVQAVVVVEWSECSTYTPTIIVQIPL